MVDISSTPNLYYAIGAGVALVLLALLVCCCCCCRRRKNNAHTSLATTTTITGGGTTTPGPPPHSKQPQNDTVVGIHESEYMLINETSPRESHAQVHFQPPLSKPQQPTPPPHYYVQPSALSPNLSTAMTDSPSSFQPQPQPYAQQLQQQQLQQQPQQLQPQQPLIASLDDNELPDVPKCMGMTTRPVVTAASIMEDPVIIASRLPFDIITPHVLLSKGGFGEVYKGSYRGNPVAIKRLLPDTKRDMRQITAFFQEVKLMATLEHPNIVKFIGVGWDALSDLSVVVELMEGGDLRAALTFFEDVQHRPLGFDKQKATIALHVAHALTYMHSLSPVVLHRDLKSKNILLDKTLTLAKLTDFGGSRERSDHTMTAAVGTILWMAPEVMSGERYDGKADVFSFGIVLSELDTHAMPYADVKASMVHADGRPMPDTALLQRIMTGRVSVSFSNALRNDVRDLAQACISVDPNMRPTAAQVLYELQKIERSMESEISIVL